jgi:hypothetical protein
MTYSRSTTAMLARGSLNFALATGLSITPAETGSHRLLEPSHLPLEDPATQVSCLVVVQVDTRAKTCQPGRQHLKKCKVLQITAVSQVAGLTYQRDGHLPLFHVRNPTCQKEADSGLAVPARLQHLLRGPTTRACAGEPS